MSHVLVLSQPADAHAAAVALALEAKGHPAHWWHTSDYPSQASETVRCRTGEHAIELPSVPSAPYATVWNRRPTHVLDETVLHPADREFAALNCRLFRKSLFDVLHPEAFWVNPHEAVRRLTKVLQTVRAAEIGLTLPDTLFTNDPEEIRRFLAEQPGGVVYKPLTSLPWKDEETYWLAYTAVLTAEDLPGDTVLRAVPGIYQALVPKDHELRVTILGDTVFTAKIHSQSTQDGRLDWRKAYHELTMEVGDLPEDVTRQCKELLRRLGFVFGCFDFVVTPEGEHVFLEVNQMGQFLFLEAYTDLPLLDAFTDFLVSGSPEFRWRRTSPGIRYSTVKEQVAALVEDAMAEHVESPEQAWRESA